jgi:hypothetical protein
MAGRRHISPQSFALGRRVQGGDLGGEPPDVGHCHPEVVRHVDAITPASSTSLAPTRK